MAELILFEINKKISYFKNCYYNFDDQRKRFVITSEDDELEINITNFTDNFCRKNNIFCVIDNDAKGFAMIFPDKQYCEEVFKTYKEFKLLSGNAMDINHFRATLRLFLTRILYEIQTNETPPSRLVPITNEIIGSLSDKEKLDFIDILPEQKVNQIKVEVVDLTEGDESDESPINSNNSSQSISSITLEINDKKENQSPETKKTNVGPQSPSSSLKRNYAACEIDTSSLENISRLDGTMTPTPKKRKSVSINQCRKSQNYDHMEVIDLDFEETLQQEANTSNPIISNGDEIIILPITKKLDSTERNATASEQISTKKSPSLEINKNISKHIKGLVKLNKPNYKLEHYIHDDGTKKEILTIYDSENSELCYTYFLKKEKGTDLFVCKNCSLLKIMVSVKIHYRNAEKIIVKYGTKNDHICQPQNEGKIFDSSQIKIKRNGNGKISEMVIYDNGNKYPFYQGKGRNRFQCRDCYRQHKACQVLLFHNENGEYYAKSTNDKHICKQDKPEKPDKPDLTEFFENF